MIYIIIGMTDYVDSSEFQEEYALQLQTIATTSHRLKPTLLSKYLHQLCCQRRRQAHFNRSVSKSIENPWEMQGAVTPIDSVVSAATGITMRSQGHGGFDGRLRSRVTAFSALG